MRSVLPIALALTPSPCSASPIQTATPRNGTRARRPRSSSDSITKFSSTTFSRLRSTNNDLSTPHKKLSTLWELTCQRRRFNFCQITAFLSSSIIRSRISALLICTNTAEDRTSSTTRKSRQ
ncbi:hypothetical protein L596_025778 [Steinernema carpocapsae]|uniref:Secreted protein n=1 Tax=Steinernema carpocapsae TaxID=34508 RepID=A0A4U5M8T3_STECR|nr:hypothetical protein L596_025778 [Steinernema carpocapsae]